MITVETIQHVARLSRLSVSDSELPTYLSQMEAILTYVDQLNQVNTEGVEPSFHPFPSLNVTREDKIVHPLSADEVFQNASDSENHCFKVPQILGG